MLVLLFVIGACIGSFLCCQARRLHLRVEKHKTRGSRSVCMGCGRRLKWYDNIPIISWVMLRGKCRRCHRPIGVSEILAEVGIGLAFLGIGTTFDINTTDALLWVRFILMLVFVSVMGFLAIYDGLYGELPVLYLVIGVVLAGAIMVMRQISMSSENGFAPDIIYNPVISVGILGGLYLVLYLVSKGKCVGDGDWILGVAIGMVVFWPWLALVELFLSNLMACVVMLPSAIKNRKSKVYFGPFMVAAMVVVISFAEQLSALVGMN